MSNYPKLTLTFSNLTPIHTKPTPIKLNRIKPSGIPQKAHDLAESLSVLFLHVHEKQEGARGEPPANIQGSKNNVAVWLKTVVYCLVVVLLLSEWVAECFKFDVYGGKKLEKRFEEKMMEINIC